MKKIFLLLFSMSLMSIHAQSIDFDVQLEPFEIVGVGGIQSYAYAQYNGYWVIIGGRLDGLHQRQPFASFSEDGNNTSIFIIDPIEQKHWKTSLNEVPVSISDQLQSTNMQYYHEGDFLILTGGYGFSQVKNDHTTYPYITVVNLPNLINAIKDNKPIAESFIQLENEAFNVAGGSIQKINSTYFLVGGHLFEGRYNPHGPTHGPGFIQEYTNEIRPFNVAINWPDISIENLAPSHDEMHLRRRDYNLVPFIRSGKEAMMIFSGVFKPTADLPWLYPVLIEEEGYTAFEDFNQYYNHYHCPTLSLYSEKSNENHTLFFGGIAQFYMENGIKVQDNEVPFVKTITNVRVSGDLSFSEHVLDQQMPDFIGAGAEFILNPELETFNNEVVNLDELGNEPIFAGTIFGGIKSSDKNIFFTNTGSESIASPVFYKVILTPKITNSAKDIEVDNINLLVYPNPTDSFVRVAMELDHPQMIECSILDQQGRLLKKVSFAKQDTKQGLNIFKVDLLENFNSSYLLIKIKVNNKVITRKVILSE